MAKAVTAIAGVVVLLLVTGTYVVYRVTGNVNDRAFEPVACQVWGGTWGPWAGWNCYLQAAAAQPDLMVGRNAGQLLDGRVKLALPPRAAAHR